MQRLFYTCSALSLTVAILAATNSVVGVGGPRLAGLRALLTSSGFGGAAIVMLFFGYVCGKLDEITGLLRRREERDAAR